LCTASKQASKQAVQSSGHVDIGSGTSSASQYLTLHVAHLEVGALLSLLSPGKAVVSSIQTYEQF
jgi:hypothetical protein